MSDEHGETRDTSEASIAIRRALAGDRESLDWVVEHMTPLLLAHARFRLHRHLSRYLDAEDLVCMVWARALPKLDEATIRPGNGSYAKVLLGYLSGILIRVYANLLTKKSHGRRPEQETEEFLLAALPTESSGAVRCAIRSERAKSLEAALGELAPIDRELLVLRAMEQRSWDEIGERYGEPLGTLTSRYSRALQKLKSCLPPSMVEELSLSDDRG